MIKIRSYVDAAKSIGLQQNVILRVIDVGTQKVVQQHIGHNSATNTLLTGIAHYLKGDGIYNQAQYMLANYVPKYMSLGTMGLYNQECDEWGYPTGIGPAPGDEIDRFQTYMAQRPGFGADGYKPDDNNNRRFIGLGPTFENRPDPEHTVNCELISKSVVRSEIAFRDVVPENEAEVPRTVDVVYSAMISTGALAQFREKDKDYIFITEAGLWYKRPWSDKSNNGLLAGYRIAPTDRKYWPMETTAQRLALKKEILRVGKNQVVQIVWKIQLGAIEELVNVDELYRKPESDEIRWEEIE